MAEENRPAIIVNNFFSFRSPRLLIVIAIGLSAFVSGAAFALPTAHVEFARVEFAHVSVAAEVADTPAARTKGLSGRQALPEFGGMLFVMDRPEYTGTWMKNMIFPVDIIWIANGTIVDMKEDARPPGSDAHLDTLPVYRPLIKSKFVLEVRAGFSRAHGIHIGDHVNVHLNGRYADQRRSNAGDIEPSDNISPSSPAGREYFIDTLRRQKLQGSDFRVGERMAVNKAYEKYAITYRSGDLAISGVMNVPTEVPPRSGFPVLILNHGLVPPSIYTTGRGSKREQDFFARHGYVTIHSDYRGHASSSPSTGLHHDFYVAYTQDVVSLLDALERSALPYIDATRIGMWGHSMGGGITARVAVLRPEVKAFVLFAPISADVEDNFYELTPEEIQWLRNTYGPAGSAVYRKMSPIEYFSDIAAPVQIHHGDGDTAVPISFSEKMYATLKTLHKPVEFFVYPGEKHEFINDWTLAASRALQFFDTYVKNR